MPGIHFAEVRARITLADVLDLLGFVPCESSGDQVRGPCLVHRSISPLSRSFSANISDISTDVSNADRPGINWICTPQRPGWASSKPPSRYASSSTEISRGCPREISPALTLNRFTPDQSAVTKWSRVQPANWLIQKVVQQSRCNRPGGTHWSPKVVPFPPVNDMCGSDLRCADRTRGVTISHTSHTDYREIPRCPLFFH